MIDKVVATDAMAAGAEKADAGKRAGIEAESRPFEAGIWEKFRDIRTPE